MNILHMKYAVEVARVGSLNKASETLLIAQPNLSRSIKELESDLGISIFERTAKGMSLTHQGEEFINMAKGILAQIEQVDQYYKQSSAKKQKFSISVPRASYISEAFAEFTLSLGNNPTEIFYQETNSQSTIKNVLENSYNMGIIRYAYNYDTYFKVLLEEKDLSYELLNEFSYKLIMSKNSPLSSKTNITYGDLGGYIEISHADFHIPSLPASKSVKEELPYTADRKIYVFERASQFDLLSKNPESFMWVSLVPDNILKKYDLTVKDCSDNKKVYKDVLIYRKGYKLSMLDKQFITNLIESKRKYNKP